MVSLVQFVCLFEEKELLAKMMNRNEMAWHRFIRGIKLTDRVDLIYGPRTKTQFVPLCLVTMHRKKNSVEEPIATNNKQVIGLLIPTLQIPCLCMSNTGNPEPVGGLMPWAASS